MKRVATVCCTVLAAGFAALGVAEERLDPQASGWTGLSAPAAIIGARQALMIEIETLMRPIDTYSIGEPEDPAALQAGARTIAAMLAAAPHLFPPTTNRYDPAAAEPATLALPTIWQEFPTFLALGEASADAATAMAGTGDAEALRAASGKLRATCDACHALFVRPYVAAGVTDEDLEFDFDAVLPQSDPQ